MPHLPEKHLHDARLAILELQGFCDGVDEEAFCARRDLQLIAERELEIIGEALARLRREFPDVAAKIPQIHRIIGLRNIIAHGYDVVDHLILWDVFENHLGKLLESIDSRLG
jgi:uncharacterized protein with HEPN domain